MRSGRARSIRLLRERGGPAVRLSKSVVAFVCLAAAGCAHGTGEPDTWVDLSPQDAGHDARADAAREYDASDFDVAADASSDAPAQPDSPAQCTLDFPTGIPACDACMQKSCCSADHACGQDSSCNALMQCLMQCPPPDPDAGLDAGSACPQACANQYPSGMNLLNALFTCMDAQCRAQCI
jgi:hypothetical protein